MGVKIFKMTQCQLSQMHKWLETNTDIVKSGLPDYSISVFHEDIQNPKL